MKISRLWLLCTLPLAGCEDLMGLGSQCDFDRDLFEASSVSGTDRVRVIAEAGALHVEGVPGLSEVRVRGRACARQVRDLDDIDLVVQRVGSVVRVTSFVGPVDARLDLILEVPDWMLAEIEDGTGDLTVENVAGVSVIDNSGNIVVEDISGDVDIDDGSGDLRVRNIDGYLLLSDDSGNIDVAGVGGSVLVDVDDSGDMRIRDIGLDVYIVEDGSGDIWVEDVLGDLTVDFDSTGRIDYHNVRGRITLPR